MNFKKLALASAIAAMPMSALALEEMADETLSDMTAQDGLEIDITTVGALTADIYIHDTDGLSNITGAAFSAYSFDGAIILDNMQLMAAAQTVNIDIDAGSSAVSGGFKVLNVAITLPTLNMQTGALRVANSQRNDAAPDWSVDAMSATILNDTAITIGGTTMNIQLGDEFQAGSFAGSDMITFNAVMTGGLTMSGFRLSDIGSGGGIGATTIAIDDNGVGTNLTANLDINATNAGLEVRLGQLGSATGVDVRISGAYLGSTSAGTIGDVAIVGLNLDDALITISGK